MPSASNAPTRADDAAGRHRAGTRPAGGSQWDVAHPARSDAGRSTFSAGHDASTGSDGPTPFSGCGAATRAAAGTGRFAAGPKTWQAVTAVDIDRDLIFTRLPPDEGVVTPIAPADEVPAQEVLDELEGIRAALPTWKPAKVEDPVQRARNLLYVAAVPDIFQMPMERYVPQLVFDQLLQDIAKDDLDQNPVLDRHASDGWNRLGRRSVAAARTRERTERRRATSRAHRRLRGQAAGAVHGKAAGEVRMPALSIVL